MDKIYNEAISRANIPDIHNRLKELYEEVVNIAANNQVPIPDEIFKVRSMFWDLADIFPEEFFRPS